MSLMKEDHLDDARSNLGNEQHHRRTMDLTASAADVHLGQEDGQEERRFEKERDRIDAMMTGRNGAGARLSDAGPLQMQTSSR